MNFRTKKSPYVRSDANVVDMMKNVVIALIPVVLFAIYFYGLAYIATLVVSLLAVVGIEYVCCKILKQESTIYNYSAIITALIYSLIISAGTPLWVVFAGGAFATIFGKLVFGGLGNNIFNPAAVGRAFVLISFGAVIPNAAEFVDAATMATPLAILGTDGNSIQENFAALTDAYSAKELFIGGAPGAYGEGMRLAILIGLAWMLYKKVADYRIVFSGFAMFIVMSALFAVVNGLPVGEFTFYSFFSGAFLFGMVFMATDPVSAPTTAPSRVLYGILIAGITFVIRMYGAYPEGMIFAILIMNMFAPLLDYSKWVSSKYNRGWIIATVATVVVLCLIVLVG